MTAREIVIVCLFVLPALISAMAGRYRNKRLSPDTRRRALVMNVSAIIALFALTSTFLSFVDGFVLGDRARISWMLASTGIFAVSTLISVRSFRSL